MNNVMLNNMMPDVHITCVTSFTSPQDYTIIKRLLQNMLKKNPDERASLSEILQDRELREALENPMGSHWSDML